MEPSTFGQRRQLAPDVLDAVVAAVRIAGEVDFRDVVLNLPDEAVFVVGALRNAKDGVAA